MKPVERHLTAIESHLDEIHDLKLRMQKLKVENGVTVEQVAEWTHGIEEQISNYEGTSKLETWIGFQGTGKRKGEEKGRGY